MGGAPDTPLDLFFSCRISKLRRSDVREIATCPEPGASMPAPFHPFRHSRRKYRSSLPPPCTAGHGRGQGQQHGGEQRRRVRGRCGVQAPDPYQHSGKQNDPVAMAPPTQEPERQADRHRQKHQSERQPASVRQDVRRHQNHASLTSTTHLPRRARTIAESPHGVKASNRIKVRDTGVSRFRVSRAPPSP
jgi:hypothetical protein